VRHRGGAEEGRRAAREGFWTGVKRSEGSNRSRKLAGEEERERVAAVPVVVF
jgi:hypothetical protein